MATITKKLGSYEYKLISERDNPDATVFILAPLNGFDSLVCWQEVKRLDDKSIRISAEGARKVLSSGLKGWRNMRDSTGNEVAYSQEMVELMEPVDINELTWEVLTNSSVSENDEKN